MREGTKTQGTQDFILHAILAFLERLEGERTRCIFHGDKGAKGKGQGAKGGATCPLAPFVMVGREGQIALSPAKLAGK